MKTNYKEIDGWFNWEWFYDEAVERANDGDYIVEIGTWSGKSAMYLGNEIRESGKDIKALCVDPYIYGLHGGDKIDLGNFHRLSDFRQLVTKEGFEDILISITSKSEFAHALIPNKSCIAVFIDGDHTTEGCAKDIRYYFPKVKHNGLFGGHDYEKQNWNSVIIAVDDWALKTKHNIRKRKDVWFVDLSLER